MAAELRRPWSVARRAFGAVLGLAVEALVMGLSILVALAVAALVLWAV